MAILYNAYRNRLYSSINSCIPDLPVRLSIPHDQGASADSLIWALRVWRLGNVYIAGTLFALSLASFAAGLALGVKVFRITTWAINIEFSSKECSYLYYSQPVGYGKDQKPNDCMADLASCCRYLNIRYIFLEISTVWPYWRRFSNIDHISRSLENRIPTVQLRY